MKSHADATLPHHPTSLFHKKREIKLNNYIKQPFHVQSGSLHVFTHTSHHSRSICSQLLCIIVIPEIGAPALCGGGGTVSPVHCPVLFCFFYCFRCTRCTWLVLIAWVSTEEKDSPVSLPPMTSSDSSPSSIFLVTLPSFSK